MAEPVAVTVVEKKKKGKLERIKETFSGWRGKSKPLSLEMSERFKGAGLLKLREQEDRDYRLYKLTGILETIETEYDHILEGDGELDKFAFRHIKRLFRAFMTIGSPWFRGLDNRELAKKAVAFFELETMVGHLSAFYPDLKLCTEALINLSWQAIDVTPPPEIIFESKKTEVIQPGYGGTMPTSGGAISQTYEPKPKGGPYEKEMSSRVEE